MMYFILELVIILASFFVFPTLQRYEKAEAFGKILH